METVFWPQSVCSCATTQSAPSGTGAPVITRAAVPGARGAGALPAYRCSETGRTAGFAELACAISALRAAYPSSGDRENGGWQTAAKISCIHTRPTAASNGMRSAAQVCFTHAHSRRAASSTGVRPRFIMLMTLLSKPRPFAAGVSCSMSQYTGPPHVSQSGASQKPPPRQIPNRDRTPTATGGTSRAGSRLSVLIRLISSIPSPELRISTPPTSDSSVSRSGVRYGAITLASR